MIPRLRSVMGAVAALVVAGCGSSAPGPSAPAVPASAPAPAPASAPSDAPPRSGTGPAADAGRSPAEAVMTAPQFTGRTVDGASISGSELWRDRPAVLVFFTSWCRTCADGAGTMTGLAEKYRDRASFVGVSADEDPTELRRFLADHRLPYPVVTDPDRRIWRSYAVREPPFTVVVRAGGEIVRGWPGLPIADLDRTLTEVTGH